MKVKGTQRTGFRQISPLLAAVMTLLCFGACPVLAEGETKSITPDMYKADSAGIAGSWEGTSGESSNVEWSNWGFIQQSYNEQQQTEHINIEYYNDATLDGYLRTVVLSFKPGLSINGANKLAIGARAS